MQRDAGNDDARPGELPTAAAIRHYRDRPLQHLTDAELHAITQLDGVGDVFVPELATALRALGELQAREVCTRGEDSPPRTADAAGQTVNVEIPIAWLYDAQRAVSAYGGFGSSDAVNAALAAVCELVADAAGDPGCVTWRLSADVPALVSRRAWRAAVRDVPVELEKTLKLRVDQKNLSRVAGTVHASRGVALEAARQLERALAAHADVNDPVVAVARPDADAV